MSIKIVLLLLVASGLAGAVIGYVFRWLLVLARKGSIELEVKQILLDAREQAKKITGSAEDHVREKVSAVEIEFKEKDEKLVRQEERLFKREETLDEKQKQLDGEIEGLKDRIEEIKTIREKADALLAERENELAK